MDWVEPEHGVVLVLVVGRRVGGRAGVGVGVVDGVELLGLMVGRVKMVGEGGGLVVRLRRGRRRSGDEVVEGGGLRGRIVVEKSAGVIVVVVVSGRVGSVDGIGVGVGREHDDVVGVSPFVVQHFVRVADDPVVGRGFEKYKPVATLLFSGGCRYLRWLSISSASTYSLVWNRDITDGNGNHGFMDSWVGFELNSQFG